MFISPLSGTNFSGIAFTLSIYAIESSRLPTYKCYYYNYKTPLGERTKVLQVAKTFIKHRKEDLERIISDEGGIVSDEPEHSG